MKTPAEAIKEALAALRSTQSHIYNHIDEMNELREKSERTGLGNLLDNLVNMAAIAAAPEVGGPELMVERLELAEQREMAEKFEPLNHTLESLLKDPELEAAEGAARDRRILAYLDPIIAALSDLQLSHYKAITLIGDDQFERYNEDNRAEQLYERYARRSDALLAPDYLSEINAPTNRLSGIFDPDPAAGRGGFDLYTAADSLRDYAFQHAEALGPDGAQTLLDMANAIDRSEIPGVIAHGYFGTGDGWTDVDEDTDGARTGFGSSLGPLVHGRSYRLPKTAPVPFYDSRQVGPVTSGEEQAAARTADPLLGALLSGLSVSKLEAVLRAAQGLGVSIQSSLSDIMAFRGVVNAGGYGWAESYGSLTFNREIAKIDRAIRTANALADERNNSHSEAAADHTPASRSSSGNDGSDGNPDSHGVHHGKGNGSRPIIVDLNGDGVSITKLSDSPQTYDTEGDGYQHRTAWVAKSGSE